MLTLCTNVADRLSPVAAQRPEVVAIASARGGAYTTCSFRELEDDATALAFGLAALGVQSGQRLVLLVKPSVEFVKLVFALLRTGAVTVLVDPGMGRKYLLNCLAAAEPDGFVAISRAQAALTPFRGRFPRSKLRVTLGRRWFWGGLTYKQLLKRGRTSRIELPATHADDPAAIIFTSGSTGPPKGVLYTHRMFDTQAHEIQRAYDLQPGGVDLACFALFGLFNSVMGVTTIFPDMDFSRPAVAEPRKLLAAANDWQVTQAFASPAVWDKLSRYCEQSGDSIPTLRKVFSCGAPVPAAVLKRTLAMIHPAAEMHTPYGATEALPVATIEAREVLDETAARTNQGAGVCVGRKFDSIDWRVIRITDDPIATMENAEDLPPGEIGELIVRGPQVSPVYAIDSPAPSPSEGGSRSEAGRAKLLLSREAGTRHRGSAGASPSQLHPIKSSEQAIAANSLAKIVDSDTIWHRMGDVGYLDDAGRFWYCGRKSHRINYFDRAYFSTPCEAIFDTHPRVRRSAVVSLGPESGDRPCLVLELVAGDTGAKSTKADAALCRELLAIKVQHPHLQGIDHLFIHPSFPVDARHNAKINREELSKWATQQLKLRFIEVGFFAPTESR